MNDPQRLACEATYFLPKDWHYLTISEWCAGWLKGKYGQEAAVMKNGLELERYHAAAREWPETETAEKKTEQAQNPPGRKIRILIEGDSAAEYKNVDESFRIAGRLNPEKYEIWYMSYNAEPKESYRVDRFLRKVPYSEVAKVYQECHILIKTSLVESFSYPPLEMMATGGAVVLAPNDGNAEYAVDGENCLTYPQGDIQAGVDAVERIVADAELRARLREGGLQTARAHAWEALRERIVGLYRMPPAPHPEHPAEEV